MQSIGTVILAAGGSSRFGSAKQLAQFRGKSLVERVVDVAQQAGCAPVIVVTGSNAAKVSSEATTPVVENKNWREGIGSSIHVGVDYLTAVEPDVSAIVLLVCDQPLLDAEVIINLRAVHQETGKEIVASSYADTLGVPALFSRSVFPELLALSGDIGAKKVILANRDRVAEFPFPGGSLDIDTPSRLRKFNERKLDCFPRARGGASLTQGSTQNGRSKTASVKKGIKREPVYPVKAEICRVESTVCYLPPSKDMSKRDRSLY